VLIAKNLNHNKHSKAMKRAKQSVRKGIFLPVFINNIKPARIVKMHNKEDENQNLIVSEPKYIIKRKAANVCKKREVPNSNPLFNEKPHLIRKAEHNGDLY
jgi:hypothetical protein